MKTYLDHPAKPSLSPLSGIKVVELSTIIFGPYASQFLGDYGADVIKVESLHGDSSRHTGPSIEPGMASTFIAANRNKRSIAIDIKSTTGRETLLALIENADVFINNIRSQKLEALGLDVQSVRKRYPRLIYTTLNGFSEAGPYSGRPAYDDIIQGMSGLADLMCRQTGKMQYFPTVAADKIAALIAAQAILAALVSRNQTNEGSHVEVSMFEALTGFAMVEHLCGQVFIPQTGPTGYSRVLAPARRPYQSLDGYICVMPYTDAQWNRFFLETGHSDLIDDPRFQGMTHRTANIEVLYDFVAEQIAKRSTREWIDALDRLDIPNAPVRRIDELLEDEHLLATDFFQIVGEGTVRLTGHGVHINGATSKPRMPPRLGEHTRELLLGLGYSESEIDAMIASGAVHAHMGGAND